MAEDLIVNKVAQSGLITLDLAQFKLQDSEVESINMTSFLFMEMILKEKDFREKVKAYDWSKYANKYVAVFCSEDAIIPSWAYMIIAAHLKNQNAHMYFGSVDEMKKQVLLERIRHMDVTPYADKRIVVKGCGDTEMPTEAFATVTQVLLNSVLSVMYGEPCSTVPVYKRKA